MTADVGTVDVAAARWSIPTLEVGASAQMIVTTTVTAAGELVNRVAASSSEAIATEALVASASTSGSLPPVPPASVPRTGSDLAVLLLFAVALSAAGFLVIRASGNRRRQAS